LLKFLMEWCMAFISTTLDHLVLVAANLDQGAAYCEEMLGVRPQPGGEHLKMGTHNLLLRLGDGMYLEVIAINPQADNIGRRRWFGMDLPAVRSRAERQPFLATFVARTNDIDACHAAMPLLGTAVDMQRGALEWRITIPEDGKLVEEGAVPTAIQWPKGVHPSSKLADLGCELERLEVSHPRPAELEDKWRSIGLPAEGVLGILQADDVALCARIITPAGVRLLY
jgi:hypothetical protein